MAAAASERLREALRVASFRSRMARMQQENAEKAAADKAAQDAVGEAAEGRPDPQVAVEGDDQPATCVICQKVLTPRDRLYVGEKRGNVCKRCDGYGQRRALKGFYANFRQQAEDAKKAGDVLAQKRAETLAEVPNPFFGDGRGKRRDAARTERRQARADRVAAKARLRQSGARVQPQPPIGTPFVKVSKMDRRRAKAAMEAELRGQPQSSIPAHLQPRPQPTRVYGHQAVPTRKRKAAARQAVRPSGRRGGTRGSGSGKAA